MSTPSQCQQLMDWVDRPKEALSIPAVDLQAMQIEAANALFSERKQQLQVLRDRARDIGIERVERREDIVPLLFSHTTYKSYPESFVNTGRWEMLTKWFATLAAVPVKVSFDGVKSIDDWVARMWEAGHFVYATSGTTGKCSFLNHTAGDRAFCERYWVKWTGWPKVLGPDAPQRRFYSGVPKEGPQLPMHWFAYMGERFGKAGERFHLGEPVRVSFLNRVGRMRKAMADGTATPEDIAAFDAEMRVREEKVGGDIRRMANDILDHRHEPLFLATWQIMWDVLEEGRKRGIPDGDFSDVFVHGSGRKKFRGPLEPQELDDAVMKFFGPANVAPRNMFYGMTELSALAPMCEAGRYHMPPWIMLLLLDRNGNHLVEADAGIVEGRAGFLDLSREGRWGGIITGDRMKVDYSPVCACGRPGPGILDNSISRYSDTGEDKVDCAGTFDAYVRGVVGGEQ